MPSPLAFRYASFLVQPLKKPSCFCLPVTVRNCCVSAEEKKRPAIASMSISGRIISMSIPTAQCRAIATSS